tara:strand:+ start:239 stop:955 length:717 start_codon:yes stop_codon:yes gene_type:complete
MGKSLLIVDDRENEVLQHALIASMGDSLYDEKGQVRIARLPSADYVMGKWGIEAKEINDFYRSIVGIARNNNLSKQLAELCQNYEVPILAIYGTQCKPYFKGRVGNKIIAREVAKMRRTMKSYKMALYARFPKIRLIEFSTMNEFVEWLTVSHTRLQAAQALSIPDYMDDVRGDSNDFRIIALSSVPGVTQKVAERLLEKFGSLKNILMAKVKQKDLMEVKGVGRVTAKRILMLREKW